MNLNCSYKFSTVEPPTITVGDLFEAHCKMETPAQLELKNLKVKFEEGKNYDLIIVRSAQSGDELHMALTSYVVGAKNLNSVVLTDGQQELFVQPPINFEVKSILKPDEKPEMFGPVSGIAVAIPLFYWVILATILVLLISSLITAITLRMKSKKRLHRIEALDDGTVPLQQFFTNYRRLQRENEIFNARSDSNEFAMVANETVHSEIQTKDELLNIISSVENALKLFIARTFRIASFEITWKATIAQLSKRHELVYEVNGNELVELSHEFQKIGIGKNKLEPKDAILISEKTRKWVEKADQLHKAIIAKDNQQIKKLRGAK